jgi:hypothetical protein
MDASSTSGSFRCLACGSGLAPDVAEVGGGRLCRIEPRRLPSNPSEIAGNWWQQIDRTQLVERNELRFEMSLRADRRDTDIADSRKKDDLHELMCCIRARCLQDKGHSIGVNVHAGLLSDLPSGATWGPFASPWCAAWQNPHRPTVFSALTKQHGVATKDCGRDTEVDGLAFIIVVQGIAGYGSVRFCQLSPPVTRVECDPFA